MKILIVAYHFAPTNNIAAVRPTLLARYLKKKGHVITVITPATELNHSHNEDFEIIKIKYKSILSADTAHSKNKVIKTYRNFKKLLQNIYDSILYTKEVKKELRILNYPKAHFDVAFVTFSPLSAILIGNYLKCEKISKKLAIDFRDIMTTATKSRLGNIFNIFVEKFVVQKGDLYTFVSEDQKKLFINRNNNLKDKTSVINNGYHIPNIEEENKYSDKFIISYTGTMYNGQRDFRVLFSILSELLEEKVICDNLTIYYAGKDNYFFEKQINEINPSLLSHYQSLGFITQIESNRLMHKSDLLLLPTWNYNDDQGILTGKFPEYLGVRKNILAFVTGNLGNAEITRIIHDLNVGYSFEIMNDTPSERAKLKTYIVNAIKEKQKYGSLAFNGKEEGIVEYDYLNITNKLESLFYSLHQ